MSLDELVNEFADCVAAQSAAIAKRVQTRATSLPSDISRPLRSCARTVTVADMLSLLLCFLTAGPT